MKIHRLPNTEESSCVMELHEMLFETVNHGDNSDMCTARMDCQNETVITHLNGRRFKVELHEIV